MKSQKRQTSRYRKPVYHKQRITTKELYSRRCKILDRTIKLILNSNNLRHSYFIHPDRINKLLEIRIQHKYLNTTWAQAGNYPKEIYDFLISR